MKRRLPCISAAISLLLGASAFAGPVAIPGMAGVTANVITDTPKELKFELRGDSVDLTIKRPDFTLPASNPRGTPYKPATVNWAITVTELSLTNRAAGDQVFVEVEVQHLLHPPAPGDSGAHTPSNILAPTFTFDPGAIDPRNTAPPGPRINVGTKRSAQHDNHRDDYDFSATRYGLLNQPGGQIAAWVVRIDAVHKPVAIPLPAPLVPGAIGLGVVCCVMMLKRRAMARN